MLSISSSTDDVRAALSSESGSIDTARRCSIVLILVGDYVAANKNDVAVTSIRVLFEILILIGFSAVLISP